MDQTRSITTTTNKKYPHIQRLVKYVFYCIQYAFVYTFLFYNFSLKETLILSIPVIAIGESSNKHLVRVLERGKIGC